MKKFMGFTFAEVFVVLFIVGFIAILTIPPLYSNITNDNTYVKVLKYNDTLTNSIDFLMSKNRFDSLDSKYSSASAFWNDLKTTFTLSKNCGTAANKECLAGLYHCLNGTSYNTSTYSDSSNRVKAIFADGTSVQIYQESPSCTQNTHSISGAGPLATVCFSINVDINGLQGPNMLGRDVFSWWVLKDGSVAPVGGDDDKFKGCDSSSSNSTESTSGAPGNGLGCTAKALLERGIDKDFYKL